jgi:integrase
VSVKKRKDGRWYIDIVIWRNGERVRIRKAAKALDRTQALKKEREERRKLDEGWCFASAVPLFKDFSGEFVTTYAVARNKPSEVGSKRQIMKDHLDPFFGEMKLDKIGAREIDRYVASKLETKLAPKTINNTLIVLRKLLVTAKDWKRISTVPTVKLLKVPKPEFDFLSFDEATRLLEATDPAWRAMIMLALRAGLRQGELLALRWDDVDLAKGELRIRQAVARGIIGTPKSGKGRDIPLSEQAADALRRLPSRFRGELVFPSETGRIFGIGQCRRALYRTCRKAGLRRIGWHVLRHTFASHLVMKGVPLKVVQELLGHASIEMTMRYAHLSPAVNRDAVGLLDTDFVRDDGRVTIGSRSGEKNA